MQRLLVATLALLAPIVGCTGETTRSQPRPRQSQRQAIREIKAQGGRVLLDDRDPSRFEITVWFLYREAHNGSLAPLEDLPDLVRLFLFESHVNDQGLVQLAKLKRLETLDLRAARISGVGLAHLRHLTKLDSLNLEDTRTDDDGLRHLAAMKRLRWLDLRNTRVTDAGLAHLAGLTNLEWLDLAGTQVTSVGLAHLNDLKSLKVLILPHHISAAALRELQDVLPELEVIRR